MTFILVTFCACKRKSENEFSIFARNHGHAHHGQLGKVSFVDVDLVQGVQVEQLVRGSRARGVLITSSCKQII